VQSNVWSAIFESAMMGERNADLNRCSKQLPIFVVSYYLLEPYVKLPMVGT
jgi:hypothetical protein